MKVTENVRSNIKPEYVSCDDYHVYVAINISEEEVPSGMEDNIMRTEYAYTVHEYTKEEFDGLIMNNNATAEDTLVDHDYRICLVEMGLI